MVNLPAVYRPGQTDYDNPGPDSTLDQYTTLRQILALAAAGLIGGGSSTPADGSVTTAKIASGGLDQSAVAGLVAALASKATPAQITAAINTFSTNLIGAAPQTLDQINELAAAIGNDPNFSVTLANQLLAKLDVTAAASTYVPFQQKADAAKTATFTASSSKPNLADISGASFDANLPAANSVPAGKEIYLKISAATDPASPTTALSVKPNGTDTINGLTTALLMRVKNRTKRLVSNGVDGYLVLGGDVDATVEDQRNAGLYSARYNPLNQQTGTAYTLALTDDSAIVEMSNAAANTVTVPPRSSVAFPIGATVIIRQYGAGQATLTAGTGVTLRSRGGAFKTAGQYAEVSVTQRAADEWICAGDLVL